MEFFERYGFKLDDQKLPIKNFRQPFFRYFKIVKQRYYQCVERRFVRFIEASNGTQGNGIQTESKEQLRFSQKFHVNFRLGTWLETFNDNSAAGNQLVYRGIPWLGK